MAGNIIESNEKELEKTIDCNSTDILENTIREQMPVILEIGKAINKMDAYGKMGFMQF